MPVAARASRRDAGLIRRRMRKITRIIVAVLCLYLAGLAVIYIAMNQQPGAFSSFMSRMPMMTFMVVPFEPLWLRARAGKLNIGDAAPDFDLETYDKKSRVRLSSFRGDKPVVLVFGSYT